MATNTFFESRLGTWVATSGAERRGDYVLVPQVWRAQLEDAGVTDQVSLALADKEDHRPEVARVARRPAADEPGCVVLRPRLCDRAALGTAEVRERLDSFLRAGRRARRSASQVLPVRPGGGLPSSAAAAVQALDLPGYLATD